MQVISEIEATGSVHGGDLNIQDGRRELMENFLDPRCEPFTPVNPAHENPPSPPNPARDHASTVPIDQTVNREMVVFLDQLLLSRLPTPEPGVFLGDSLAYSSWKSAFRTLIEIRAILAGERIHYLKRYLSGAAKETVESYFLLLTDDSYDDTIRLLDERYGDPFVVASAFRDKLDRWPKIASRDGVALRKLPDFLRQCTSAMKFMRCLNVLDGDRENRKLLVKLLDWLVNRWAPVVAKWKRDHMCFPPFTEFSKFVSLEADIACDPTTSLQAVRAPREPEDRRKSHVFVADAIVTSCEHDYRPECAFCTKGHAVDDCRAFLARFLQERKTFATQRGLCFGCMEPD